jgi:hypothetical protein
MGGCIGPEERERVTKPTKTNTQNLSKAKGSGGSEGRGEEWWPGTKKIKPTKAR